MYLYVCCRKRDEDLWSRIDASRAPWDDIDELFAIRVGDSFKKETGFGLCVQPRAGRQEFFSRIDTEWNDQLECALQRCSRRVVNIEANTRSKADWIDVQRIATARAWVNLLSTYKLFLERGLWKAAILGE